MFRASPKFLEKLDSESKSKSTLPPDQRAFLDAARTGATDKVRELLAKGVPVDLREDFCVHYFQNEQTALMYAAGAGHLEVIRLLLKAGANITAVDKNRSREDDGAQTPLHYAAQQKNIAVIEEFLSAGADVNALTKDKNTPLNKALWFNNPEGAQLLVKRGTHLSSKIGRKQARSPLFVAVDAIRNDLSVETVRGLVLLLLEAGADPNGVGNTNMTAVFPLTFNEKLPEEAAAQLLEELLKAGAKPDWMDKCGSTPLQNALLRQRPQAVKLLLEAGADVNRILTSGTALDINEQDTKMFQKNLQGFLTAPPPADEKAAARQQQCVAFMEDKLRRCKEIAEILQTFGAKRKSELPQPS